MCQISWEFPMSCPAAKITADCPWVWIPQAGEGKRDMTVPWITHSSQHTLRLSLQRTEFTQGKESKVIHSLQHFYPSTNILQHLPIISLLSVIFKMIRCSYLQTGDICPQNWACESLSSGLQTPIQRSKNVHKLKHNDYRCSTARTCTFSTSKGNLY